MKGITTQAILAASGGLTVLFAITGMTLIAVFRDGPATAQVISVLQQVLTYSIAPASVLTYHALSQRQGNGSSNSTPTSTTP